MKFRYSLENFRGLAILFVMMSHMASLNQLAVVGDYLHFLVADATTWFVFISGYLFHYIESDKFSYRAYLGKKAKYVVLPYFFLSVPPIAAGLCLSHAQSLDLAPTSYVAWSLVVGGAIVHPMWFIPMIAIFFLLSPLFNRAAKSRSLVVLAAAGVLLSIFSCRPINNFNPGLSFLHFVGFYLLGLLLAVGVKKVDALKASGGGQVMMLAGLAVFLASAFVYETSPSSPAGFFAGLGILNLVQLGKLALLVAVFFFFEIYGGKQNAILAYFAKVSFGLFFVHGFYMVAFGRIWSYIDIDNTAVEFFAEFIFIIVGSIATVYVAQLVLKKRSRYVIGC